MARIPVEVNPLSDKKRELVAVFYIDGREYTRVVNHIEEFAIPTVIAQAYAQVEDPDAGEIASELRQEGEPLPPGW
jgi:hypothetical protein